VNSFVLELCSIGGFPLEEASEIFSQDNKGIIFWINCVIVLTVSFFLLTIVIKIVFTLHISFWYLTSGIKALSSIDF
jgi:hypothetical protein